METTIHYNLTLPFETRFIKWRIGSTNKKAEERKTGDKYAKATKGIVLAYIDARDVMNRLDNVLGPENWQDKQPREGYCELAINFDGTWITKSDCAGETSVEAEKGQASDAFKRAAVKFGIGRYLYGLPNIWIQLENGYLPKNFKGELPAWALPENWSKYYNMIYKRG